MDTSSAGRLLLVAIDLDTSTRVRDAVAKSLPDGVVAAAPTIEDARGALSQEKFACVVVEAAQPLLDELAADAAGPIVIGMADDREQALAAIQRGAFDCLVGTDDELAIVRAVRHAAELYATRREARLAQQRNSALRELTPNVGYWELDPTLVPVFADELCTETGGLAADDPDSYRRALADIPKDDLPAVFEAREAMKTDGACHIVHRRVRSDGEIRMLDVRGVRVDDVDGEVIGYLGGVADVTERLAIAKREEISRAQLEAVFANSPSAMFFKDMDGRYVFVNRPFAAYFGRDVSEFPGRTDEDLYSASFAALVRARDRDVLASGGPITYEDEMPTPDGSALVSSVAFPVVDESGVTIGVCGLAEDVTARREIENRFRSSFDDAPVGMSLTRPDGTWLNVNKALADLLGYEREELLDRSFRDFTHPDDREEDSRRLGQLLRKGGTLTREKRLIRCDGTVLWVLSCVDIARDSTGRPLWALTHVLDITQRKRAEHELQRQQVDMLTIARVARDAGAAENPALEVCRVAGQITDAANVGLLEARGTDELILTAAIDEHAPVGLVKRFDEVPFTSGLAASSRERLFIGDLGDVLSQNWGPHADVRSAVFEPIMRGSELLGVMSIAWSETRDALSPRESSVIRLLAAEMATIIERARLHAQLRELARTDPLTGLANRRVWDERVDVELTHAKRFSSPLCIALLDLDHFKPYNDTYGHQAGDRLLSAATAAWTTELRAGDLMARVGGDEFAVLLPDCDLEGGQALIERLRVATPASVGCSVGIVQWDGSEQALEAIGRADAALYAAKESGRARSVAG